MSNTKIETRPAKGKDYEIAKWEEEIRKSLASKKSTPATLTKQQQALVQAQLEKESKIRQNVNTVQAHLLRGLNFIKSLVAAKVDEFQYYMSSLVSLLLDGALGRGSFLAGSTAFETYIVRPCLAYTRSCLTITRHRICLKALRSVSILCGDGLVLQRCATSTLVPYLTSYRKSHFTVRLTPMIIFVD